MSYILSVSGPVDPPEMLDIYQRAFRSIERDHDCKPYAIMTGCAFGVDTHAVYAALAMWTGIKIICVVPAAPHNENLVKRMGERHNTEIIRLTAAFSVGMSERYMARNDELAKRADELVAFPRTSIEAIRSGTWATVRRFRNRHKPVYLFPFGN